MLIIIFFEGNNPYLRIGKVSDYFEKTKHIDLKMTYQETIEYIFSRMPSFQTVGSSGYKPGIESMKTMDAYFGHPH